MMLYLFFVALQFEGQNEFAKIECNDYQLDLQAGWRITQKNESLPGSLNVQGACFPDFPNLNDPVTEGWHNTNLFSGFHIQNLSADPNFTMTIFPATGDEPSLFDGAVDASTKCFDPNDECTIIDGEVGNNFTGLDDWKNQAQSETNSLGYVTNTTFNGLLKAYVQEGKMENAKTELHNHNSDWSKQVLLSHYLLSNKTDSARIMFNQLVDINDDYAELMDSIITDRANGLTNLSLATNDLLIKLDTTTNPQTIAQSMLAINEGRSYDRYAARWTNTNGSAKREKDKDDISLNETKDWIMYPNPTKDYVNIQLKAVTNRLHINIYSISGQLEHSYEIINSDFYNIDTKSYTSGMYFVEVVDLKGVKSVQKLSIIK